MTVSSTANLWPHAGCPLRALFGELLREPKVVASLVRQALASLEPLEVRASRLRSQSAAVSELLKRDTGPPEAEEAREATHSRMMNVMSQAANDKELLSWGFSLPACCVGNWSRATHIAQTACLAGHRVQCQPDRAAHWRDQAEVTVVLGPQELQLISFCSSSCKC